MLKIIFPFWVNRLLKLGWQLKFSVHFWWLKIRKTESGGQIAVDSLPKQISACRRSPRPAIFTELFFLFFFIATFFDLCFLIFFCVHFCPCLWSLSPALPPPNQFTPGSWCPSRQLLSPSSASSVTISCCSMTLPAQNRLPPTIPPGLHYYRPPILITADTPHCLCVAVWFRE